MEKPKHNILVVDDEENVRQLLLDVLANENRAVLCVATVAEARQALDQNKIDLMILDRMLPDGDGLDFCTELRNSPRHSEVLILIFSGRTEDTDRLMAINCGADAYIGKPGNMAAMEERVTELLAK
ncbi:MAG: response regulator [Elusimicrobia bacterium]|nr:response regulator [Elusimicrobiota bacterium]